MARNNGARREAAVLDPDHELEDAQPAETSVVKEQPDKETAPVTTLSPAVAVKAEPVQPGNIALNMPTLPAPKGVYLQKHIDLRLNNRQQQAIRWMYEGLHSSGQKLANGRHVDSVPDVVRFILDRTADSLGIE